MARIGLFGGSFNPVHNGHLAMAVAAIEELGLDRLRVIPVAAPPHKPARDLLSGALRLTLLESSFRGLRQVVLDDRELRRGGTSYTIDTVRELRAESPDAEFWFLIGADSLPDLGRWREADLLAKSLAFAVAGRPGSESLDVEPLRRRGFRLHFLRSAPLGISSTEVRRRCAEGRPLHGLVPESVAAILEREGAYRPVLPGN